MNVYIPVVKCRHHSTYFPSLYDNLVFSLRLKFRGTFPAWFMWYLLIDFCRKKSLLKKNTKKKNQYVDVIKSSATRKSSLLNQCWEINQSKNVPEVLLFCFLCLFQMYMASWLFSLLFKYQSLLFVSLWCAILVFDFIRWISCL